MPSVFLDTNVLIYAAIARNTDPEKWKKAIEIVAESDFATSGQVMAEFVHAVRRKSVPPFPEERLDRWLDSLCARPWTPIDDALVREGVATSRRYRIGYYDAAIIAAAERLGAGLLYTEDLNHGQVYGSVRVENPFVG